jgi:hypothetical protein
MKKKNGLLQTFFYDFFENSSDELGTGNTRHLRKTIVNNLLIFVTVITPGLIYLVKDNDPDKEFNQP